MTGAPHRHFHDELAELKDRLLHMSSRVEEAVGRAVKALLDRDGETAADVIRMDREIEIGRAHV